MGENVLTYVDPALFRAIRSCPREGGLDPNDLTPPTLVGSQTAAPRFFSLKNVPGPVESGGGLPLSPASKGSSNS